MLTRVTALFLREPRRHITFMNKLGQFGMWWVASGWTVGGHICPGEWRRFVCIEMRSCSLFLHPELERPPGG